MNRFSLPLALTAVALVAACAHKAEPVPVVVVQQPPAVVAAPASPTVTVQQAAPAILRAGDGRIESLSATPTAGTGTTAPSAMRRYGIKMDDGSMQYVDSDAPNLAIGQRVQLTADGYIRSMP